MQWWSTSNYEDLLISIFKRFFNEYIKEKQRLYQLSQTLSWVSSFSITAAARYHLTCHYWNHVLWKTREISFTTKGITSICIENCLAFGVMKLYKVVEAPKGSWWLVHRFPVKAQAFFVVKSRRATLSISAIRFLAKSTQSPTDIAHIKKYKIRVCLLLDYVHFCGHF